MAVSNETKALDQEDDEDYSLLNAFEMLWNVESAQALRQAQQKQLEGADSLSLQALSSENKNLPNDKSGNIELVAD